MIIVSATLGYTPNAIIKYNIAHALYFISFFSISISPLMTNGMVIKLPMIFIGKYIQPNIYGIMQGIIAIIIWAYLSLIFQ